MQQAVHSSNNLSTILCKRNQIEKREPCGVCLTPMAVSSYYSQSNRRKSAQHSNEGVEGLPTCFNITCTVNKLRWLNMQHSFFLPIRLQYDLTNLQNSQRIMHSPQRSEPTTLACWYVVTLTPAHIMSWGKWIEKSDGICSFIMKCAENRWL